MKRGLFWCNVLRIRSGRLDFVQLMMIQLMLNRRGERTYYYLQLLFSVTKQVKMQIFYKVKNGKTVSLEISPEETEKIRDKGGIRPCNVSLTKIDTRCHCGNFSLQEFLLKDISQEIDICFLSPDEADINEANVESTEIEEPPLPIINTPDEGKLKQMKDDLRCNLRAELKNMVAVNKIDTDVNNRIPYKKHIEVYRNS